MAPKKVALLLQLLAAAACASVSSIRPADRSASIAICLPGMASRVKRAATSAMRPEPLVMTTKFTITRMAKTITPMTKLPPIMKLPKASMTWPAAVGALVAVAEDQARRGEVERQPQQRRDQQHRREGGEFQRLLDEQRRHQDQDRAAVIESASSTSSSNGGSGRISTTRIADDAERQRHLAARQRPAAGRRRR